MKPALDSVRDFLGGINDCSGAAKHRAGPPRGSALQRLSRCRQFQALPQTVLPPDCEQVYAVSNDSAVVDNPPKRRYPRIKLPRGILIAWEFSDKRVVSQVTTMGLGGLFISTPDPPPVGSVLKMLLDLPGGEVRARATVRDSKPGEGMGVEFTMMGHEGRARLQQLLKRLSS